MMAEVVAVGDACFPHYLGRRRLPDVCGYPASRIASVDVCDGVCVLRLPSLDHHLLFVFKLLGFSDPDEVKYRNH